MREFSRKTILLLLGGGIIIGLIVGLAVGWIVWPVEYFDADLCDLGSQDKNEYVVMVGAAYALNGDISLCNK